MEWWNYVYYLQQITWILVNPAEFGRFSGLRTN
jgi:hypothetical protein